MALQIPNPAPFLLLLLLLLLSATAAKSAAFQSELETMTDALRSHGSTLFTNAIATTDLQFQLLSSPSPSAFTIFVPKDSLLYALDMISDSSTYISTLRYHVIPHRRHTFLHLQNLSSPFLQTLLPHYSLLVSKTRESDELLLQNSNSTVSVMVDGVRISSPDLFVGRTLAVHGIDGILVTGLNMYQDFDLDPGTDTTSISSPPPPPPSPAVLHHHHQPPPKFDYYDSPRLPPAASPISSPPSPSNVVFDDEGTGIDPPDPPAFSDQDPMSYWDGNGNSNDWTINGIMMDYDGSGSHEEMIKKMNFGKRKRSRKVTEKPRRLRGDHHRHHLLDL